MEFRLTSAAFVAVFATYLFLGGMGVTDRGNPDTRDAAYNLLARGLISGHLSVDKEAPAILTQLKDPYDPDQNSAARTDPRYRLHDFSYYRGRLYLYFGVAPAVLLFIPWHLLTGGWLPHWVAVVVLCSAGLLVNMSLLRAVRLRAFPDSGPWLAAACTLVLGLGSYAPLLLARADLWEIPIAFNYLMVSVALRSLWAAFGSPGRATGPIALASAALGLAFAARPTVLPNAAILLIPFLSVENRRSLRAWACAVLPLAVCGAAVAWYNLRRFGSPFDFGMRYQLASEYVARLHVFSPGYVWTNLRLYLFQGVEWLPLFPFAHEPPQPVVPLYHGGTEHISGALLNAPILWAAVSLPMLMRPGRAGRGVVLVCASAAWVALSSLLLLSFFYGACSRYQFEFVPELALLASVGVMAVEGAWAGGGRLLARCVWTPALAISAAFPVLYGIDRCASDHNHSALDYLASGDLPDARRDLEAANFLSPGNPFSRLGTGFALVIQGRLPEAQGAFEGLTRDFPGYPMAHFFLGNVLASEGILGEAIAEYSTAHRLDPRNPVIKAALDGAVARRK